MGGFSAAGGGWRREPPAELDRKEPA